MTTDLEGAVELDEAHRALTAASRQLPELWEQPNKAAVGVVVKPQHLRLILAALKAARHDYHTKTREADDALASITRELDEALERERTNLVLLREMRDLVKDHPDFQKRDFVPLGIAMGNALHSRSAQGGETKDAPRSIAQIVADWPRCDQCGSLFPGSFTENCNRPECPGRAALVNGEGGE